MVGGLVWNGDLKNKKNETTNKGYDEMLREGSEQALETRDLDFCVPSSLFLDTSSIVLGCMLAGCCCCTSTCADFFSLENLLKSSR